MSGMKYLPLTGEDLFPDFNPETWDTLKNGSRAAVLAGHGQATARMVHEEALRLSSNGSMNYEEAETAIVKYLSANDNSRVNLNAALDKFSQPMQPGPMMDKNHRSAGAIMKARRVNKSSKGKHPSNLTPPKKKRK